VLEHSKPSLTTKVLEGLAMAESTTTPAEVWRAIPENNSYEVSSIGRVRSVDRLLPDGRHWAGRDMAQKISANGYNVIALSVGCGKYRHCGVHQLVCEAFNGVKPSSKHQVAHGDGNKANNRFENLRWATAAENAKDRAMHGNTAHLSGEDHGASILTEKDVKEMRSLKLSGATADDLAIKFNVSRWTVFDAVSGRTWGHL